MESSLSFMTFKGSVIEAMSEAKNQSKLFVVYISVSDKFPTITKVLSVGVPCNSALQYECDDADTSSLERYTLRSLIVAQFVSKYCIFLHLPAESADGTQFSAIYPQKSIPSITVVGLNGVKLWQHEGYIDPEALAPSLEKAWLNLHIQETSATVGTTTLASKSFEVATNSTPRTSTSTSSHSRTFSGPTLSCEDRLQIPEKPKPTSQKVDDGKMPRPTILIDEESESYNTSKLEKVSNEEFPSSTEAADDHLDRDTLVGYINNSEDDHPGPSNDLDFRSDNDPSEPGGSVPTSIEDKMEEYKRAEGVGRTTKDKSMILTRFDKLNDVHLNIRLTNGSSLQEKFSLTSTLQMVKEYVDNNQAADFGSYDLAIPYPRKVFDNQELSKSLCELGLFNRQALVVVPHQRPASDGKRGISSLKRATSNNTDDSAENGEGYFAFAKWILSYANPFAYLGGAAPSPNSEQESRSRIGEYGPTTNRKRSISNPNSSRSLPNESSSDGRSGGAPATSRSGSNIHTLKHDKDDERFSNRNVFWNGNSTQYGGDDGEAK